MQVINQYVWLVKKLDLALSLFVCLVLIKPYTSGLIVQGKNEKIQQYTIQRRIGKKCFTDTYIKV